MDQSTQEVDDNGLSEIDFELPFIACPEPTGSEALPRQTRQSPDKYLVKSSLDLLEAENLKSKDLANEQSTSGKRNLATTPDPQLFNGCPGPISAGLAQSHCYSSAP